MEIDIDAAGSATAFEDLASGASDLGLSSRRIQSAEVDRAREAGLGDLGAPASENVIGLDGIAVIVNERNPVRALSTDAIARIFDGDSPTWPAAEGAEPGPVDVYARDDRSGTYDTFKALVLGDRPLSPKAKRMNDSAELSSAVASDPQGVGFVGMSLVGRTSAVAVSSGSSAIFPSRFSVGSEDYPLTRRLYVYAPARVTHPLASRFVEFALSPEGQTLVAANGFVNLSALASDSEACASCSAQYAEVTRGARRLSLTFRFRPGESELDSRGTPDVGRLASVLRMERNPDFMLLGYSDNQGAAEAKAQVSRERAEHVGRALEAYGVHPSVVLGLGDERAVADNETPAGRDRNRRVEVWIRAAAAPAPTAGAVAPKSP
jgi:phosphate transport system substrate-binding protein